MDNRSTIERIVKAQIKKTLAAEMVQNFVIPLSYTHSHFWSDQFAAESKIADRALDAFDIKFLHNALAARKKFFYVSSLILLPLAVLCAFIIKLQASSADQRSSEQTALMLLPLIAMPIALLLIDILMRYLFKLSLNDAKSVECYLNEKTEHLFVKCEFKEILDSLSMAGSSVTWITFTQKINTLSSDSAMNNGWQSYLTRKLKELNIIKKENTPLSTVTVDTTNLSSYEDNSAKLSDRDSAVRGRGASGPLFVFPRDSSVVPMSDISRNTVLSVTTEADESTPLLSPRLQPASVRDL